MMTQTNQTKMRPFTFDDAQQVVDLFNAYSQHLHGWDEFELGKLMNEWRTPGFNAEEMIRVVEDARNEIIGYIEVWDTTHPHVIKYVWGVLHPQAWDDNLYIEMLSWAENYSSERVALAPAGSRVIMKQGVPHMDIYRKKALETYSFELVRYFYRMGIDLNQSPPLPSLPQGLIIEPIQLENEFTDAVLAMEEAFKDHWGHVERPIEEILEERKHFLYNDEDFDPSLWYLAKEGDQIAGACRCANKTNEDPEMGWVNQLCVGKAWRQRGLGTALLLTAFNEFHRRGKARAGLVVDASSLTNATRLYEKAGMHVTLQYDTYEKVLRPGEDLMKT